MGLMNTYNKEIEIVKGEGCYVTDKDGKKYLDLIGGIGTCTLGYNVHDEVYEQMKKIVNTSNLYKSPSQEKLAELICNISGYKHCFFSNSGTESVECALKLAKKHGGDKIIAMKNGFHGRTIGSLSVTGKDKIKKPFGKLLDGINFIDFGSLDGIKEADVLIMEPIQGEAGVIMPPDNYLEEVSKLCKENNTLLIFDEVQTGAGRTGKFFCFEHYGIKPDIVTIAKGVANGFPIGITLSNLDFEKGEHGTTYGGNDVSCVSAYHTIKKINSMLDEISSKGEYFMNGLKKLNVTNVRGKGLMIGFDMDVKCELEGILVNKIGGNIIRLLPPYVISYKEIDMALNIFKEAQ